MKFIPSILSVIAVIYVSSTGSVSAHITRFAPIFVPQHAEVIPHEFIVSLKEPAASFAGNYEKYVDEHLNKLFAANLLQSSELLHKYELGYAAVLSPLDLAHLRTMFEVEFIEANQVVSVIDPVSTKSTSDLSNWGLERISQRDLPLSGKYPVSETAGEGVDVYVIDTGINIAHEEFEGRAIWGLTAPRGDEDADGNGHGSHVASTIAGKTFGVANKATVIAVKVLRSSGYGSMSDVLKGINWAAQEHVRKSSLATKGKIVKSVANMSLGGGKSPSLDRAVDRAIAKGVLFAVAAGNDNADACQYSPAAANDAITVGATTRDDDRAWFSNWGSCVDIFAPGHEITAAWIGSKTATRTISGTSMASPHVAGVMALFAADGEYTPAELKAKIIKLASMDKLSDVGQGSPNSLLYSNPPVESRVTDAAAAVHHILFTIQRELNKF